MTGDKDISFGDYVKYGQAYLNTRIIAAQRYDNKNRTDSLINAVKNKEYPIIFVSRKTKDEQTGKKKAGGHAVTGLKVLEDSSEKTSILVYNSSKSGNSFVDTLVIKGDGNWEIGNYKSTDDDAYISYCLFDSICESDIIDTKVVENNGYLIFAKMNIHQSNMDFLGFDRFNSQDSYLFDNGYCYWSENGVFSLKPESLNGESGEANYLSIFGDDDKTTLTFPFSSEIEVNKPEGKYDIVMNADTEQKAIFTYEYCEEKPRKIEINSVSSGDIHFVTSDNGLIVSCDNGGDKELSVTATDEKGDSRTIAVPVTQNDISITAGGKLIVSEDTTKDGLFDKIIAEEPFVTDISSDTVSIVKLDDQTYTGEEIKPDILLKHDNDLKKDTDYTVSYSNNINVGTATVIITGKGNYKGTITKTFNINPAPISPATVTGIAAKSYTGKALTQSPVVKVGSTTLKANSEYTVAYKNNINAGKATVTITGKGNYTGTKTATFKINKAAQSIMAKARASRIAVGKTTTVSITGNNGTKSYKSSNTAIATVTSAGKITAKKVGTVKITATSAATANYNAASKTVTIKVVPAATASLTAANQATGIKLTWKKVTGANGYKIYRGSTLIKTITSGSTVSFVDTKANTNGTKYTYKVVAKATTGDSTLSKSRVIYRVSRPAISSVTNSASKKMTVKWGKNAKANGYQIQYSTDKNFKSGNKAVSITSASTVSKVIGSLTKGKTYYVRIRTYKTVGSTKYWSIWSAARSVKISK